MNKLLLAFSALLTIASAAIIVPQEDLNIRDSLVPQANIRKNGITGRGIFLEYKGKKAVQKFVKKFKDGYKKDDIIFDLQESILKMNVTIQNFTVLGFDNVEIKELEIGYTLSQSVKFNFLLPQVNITGKMLTDSLIDGIKEYGIKLNANVESDVELNLENITFQGYFKYTMPFLWGSIRIYKFDASIVFGNVVSRFDGLLGNGVLNQLLNDKVEDILLTSVNSNKDEISAMLREILVPFVNSKLEDKNFWSII